MNTHNRAACESDHSAGKKWTQHLAQEWKMETPAQPTNTNTFSSILGLQSLQTPENVEATSRIVKRGRKPKKGRIYNFNKRKSWTQSGAVDELPRVAVADDDYQRYQLRDPSTTGKHETPTDRSDIAKRRKRLRSPSPGTSNPPSIASVPVSLATPVQPAEEPVSEKARPKRIGPKQKRFNKVKHLHNQFKRPQPDVLPDDNTPPSRATSLQEVAPHSSPTHQHEPDAHEVDPSCVKVVNRNLGEDEIASGNSTLHRSVELPLVFVNIPMLNPRTSASCQISVLPTSPAAPVLLSPPSSDSSWSDDDSGEEFNPANEPRNSDTVSEDSQSQVEPLVSLIAGEDLTTSPEEGTPRHDTRPPPLRQDLPSPAPLSSSSSSDAGSDDSSDDPEYRPELDREVHRSDSEHEDLPH